MDDDLEIPVVLERILELRDHDTVHEVRLRIWQPQLSKVTPPKYDCQFEVAGLPHGTERHSEVGLDSTQALVKALKTSNDILRPHVEHLLWQGFADDEIPFNLIAIIVEDFGRKRQIERIIEEEQFAIECRQAIRARLKFPSR